MNGSEWKEIAIALLKKHKRNFSNREVLIIADFIEVVGNDEWTQKEK